MPLLALLLVPMGNLSTGMSQDGITNIPVRILDVASIPRPIGKGILVYRYTHVPEKNDIRSHQSTLKVEELYMSKKN